jgi:hypothetical protein
VDLETIPLDPSDQDGAREFAFTLTNDSPTPDAPIDRVTVQVCQSAGPMLPAFTCGEVQSYTPRT